MRKRCVKALSIVLTVVMMLNLAVMTSMAATVSEGENGNTIFVSAGAYSAPDGTKTTSVSKDGIFFIGVNFSNNPTTLADSIQNFGLFIQYDSAKIQPMNWLGQGLIPSGVVYNAAGGIITITWAGLDGIYVYNPMTYDNEIQAQGCFGYIRCKALADLTESDLNALTFLAENGEKKAKIADASKTFTIVQAPALSAEFGSTPVYTSATADDVKAALSKVTYIDADGSETNVSSPYTGVTVTLPTGGLKVGANDVTVTYNGVSTTASVTAKEDALASIAITTPPSKTAYTAFETFNKAGMVVTATYESGKTAVVTDYTVAPDTALKVADNKVTVTYQGKTATQTITVNKAAAPTGLSADQQTLQAKTVITGKTFDLSELIKNAPTDAGALSYSLASKSDNITASVSGTTLTVNVPTGQTAETTASAVVTVSSENRADATVSIPFIFKDKIDVSSKLTMADVNVEYGQDASAAASYSDADSSSTWTYSYSGTTLGGTTYGPSATAPTDAGNYTVTATYDDTKEEGGIIGHTGTKTANVTITPKAVTITGVTADSKTYDGTAAATAAGTAAVEGKVGTDDVTVTAGTAAFADKNVGTAKTVSFSGYALAGADKDNYTLSAQPADVTADITAKALTVSGVTATSRAYEKDNTTVALTGGTLAGVESGDTVTLTLGTGTVANANVGTNKAVTTNIQLAGADKGNYTLTQPTDVKATITKAAAPTLTDAAEQTLLSSAVITGSKDYTYDLASLITGMPADAGTLNYLAADGTYGTSAVSGSTLTFTVAAAQAKDTTDSVTVTVSSQNYADATAKIPFVFKDKVDVSASLELADKSVEYGQDATVTGTYSGADSSSTWTYSYVGTGSTTYGPSATAPTDVGTYSVTATYDDTKAEGDIPGHTGTKTANVTITPKAVTITGVTADNKEYDGTAAATASGTAAIEGKVGTDDVSVTAGTAAFADKNVGTGKTVSFTGYALAGADKDNYTLSAQPADVTADITPKALALTGVTAPGQNYVKGKTTVDLDTSAAALTGKVGTEDVDIDTITGTMADDTANTGKPVTIAVTLKGADKDNYTVSPLLGLIVNVTDSRTGVISFTFKDTTKTPNPKDVTFTAADKDKAFSDVDTDVTNYFGYQGWIIKSQDGTTTIVANETKVTDDILDALAAATAASEKLTAEEVVIYTGGGGGGSSTTVTIVKVDNGKATASNTSARAGQTVTITATPNEGYKVENVVAVDSNGNNLTVTQGADGKFSFTMPNRGTVKVTPSFTKIEEQPPVDPGTDTTKFVDVPAGSFYYDPVYWAVEKGITNGTDATHFSPDTPCTRAQAVTFFWRAAGQPAATITDNPFTDVKEGTYYYDAVLWAVEKGITKGTSDTTFSPNLDVNRKQMVTFLYRAAGEPAVSADNPFTDVPAGQYYTNAVLWAVENGITTGTSDTTFSPDQACLRSQIVTFLYRVGLAAEAAAANQ